MGEEELVEVISISVDVTKEAYDIGDSVLYTTSSVKKQLDQGKPVGEAILAGVLESAPVILEGIQGYKKLPDEAKKATCEFTLGLAIPAIQAVFKALEKK